MHLEKPFVSIVIPAFNSASTLSQTIKACMDQDYPKDKFEIMVVDDGSSDNTGDAAAGFNPPSRNSPPVKAGCPPANSWRSVAVGADSERNSASARFSLRRSEEKDSTGVNPWSFNVRYIYQKRSGPASARNNGWKNSKGDAVCFTDADCIPESDWISKLVRHYNADNTGAVAGSYSVHGSPYLLDKFVHYEIQDRHSRMPEYISSFGTYNVMIKRAVLEVTGGFNPEYYKASGEDTDLSYKIIRAGYRIYFAKDALVNHKNILRVWKYFLVQFRHGYWRMKLYKKNASMISRDEYGYWKDFLELSLGAASLLFLALGFKNSLIFFIVSTWIIFFIQLPLVIKIAFYERDIFYITFSFVTFFRVFVRVAGGVFGFIRFWIFII